MGADTPPAEAEKRALDEAMDWTERAVLGLCAEQEVTGVLLHLVDENNGVDVVFLSEAPPHALHTARALIVVHAPAVAVVALESYSVQIDKERLRNDPLLRDWWRRRRAGEDVGVCDLPGDYVQELLLLAGETAGGAQALRSWYITGTPPRRSFRPSTDRVAGRDPLFPLFMQSPAQDAGMDPAELRDRAERYLAHTHHFDTVYDRDKDEERE